MRAAFSLSLTLAGAVFTAFSIARPSQTSSLSLEQKPLLSFKHEYTRQNAPLYPYSVREHAPDAEVCDAGSKQYTGTVSVSDEKKLFFWFFESRNDPANSPVTVWLNGGPGGSSLMGLFLEVGPCVINKHSNRTVFEKHSWTEFTNLLVIDQPAGVGFSTIRGGDVGGPDNVVESSEDLNRLLMTFFADIFPQYSENPLHIAGESFGGRYVPGLMHYIYTRLQQGSTNVLSKPIESIILVDAVIDTLMSSDLGLYDHFCKTDPEGNPTNKKPFNSTACDALEKATPECERLVMLCQNTYDPNVCKTAWMACEDTLGRWFMEDVREGGRDPYDDRKTCGPNPPICEPFAGSSPYPTFVNQSHIKTALGFPSNFSFSALNWDLNQRWEASKEVFMPNTRELSFVLDHTDIRVLVLNGNNDIVVNTEGQKRVYDGLAWRRQAGFRARDWRGWEWPEGSGEEEGKEVNMKVGGEWKKADDGDISSKLAFFTIDEAGHASPGDQREAIRWLVGCWTGKADERCPV